MRLDVELISPEQASRINPFLKPTSVVAAMRIDDDRYFDPAQVAVGYARAAAAEGATLLAKTILQFQLQLLALSSGSNTAHWAK